MQDVISRDQWPLWNLAAAVGGFGFAANSLETLLQDLSNMTMVISVFDLQGKVDVRDALMDRAC